MRHAVVGLVILLLGLAAWWLLGTAGPEAKPTPVATAPGPAVDAVAGAPVTSAASADEPQRAAVETKDAPAADASALRVRVVEDATLQPVPGAEVLWYDESFALAVADRDLWRSDREQLLRQRGQRAVADAEGRVALRVRGSANLQGRSGDQYGSAVWRPDVPLATEPPFVGEFLLRLQTDRTLLVRAVDGQGQTVSAVGVQIEQTHRLAAGGTARALENLPATGPDGLTRLRHAQESFPAGGSCVAATVRARISGADGEPTAIDPVALPTAPVDVVVPGFGSVLVELFGPDGAPWSLPASSEVDVMLVLVDWSGGGVEPGINSEQLDRHGRATFARVRCGLQWKLRGPTGWKNSDPFDGPVRPGEQVRAALRLAADAVLVAGRVVREDGAPFVEPVTMRFEGRDGRYSITLPLDAQARFCVPVPQSMGSKPTITLLQQVDFGVPQLEGEVVLRGALVPGRNDLGDVVMREPPLLVAGQLVLAAGAAPASLLDRVYLQIERCEPGERASWNVAERLGVRRDAEHRFAVRGAPKGGRWRLVVSGDCAPLAPREFVPGTKDLRIEIATGSSVTATFVPDPLLAWLTHRLVPAQQASTAGPDDLRPGMPSMGSPPQREGDRIKVSWSGLAGGSYRLLVGCQGLDPLLDLLVHVPVGGAADDPRLIDIDLRGRLHSIRVTVTDEAGKRFEGKATIVLRGRMEPDTEWYGQSLDEDHGAGERFVVSQPVDLIVTAPGHRGVAVPGVFADTTVALQPAPKVTLLWPDPPTLPEGISASLRGSPADWPARGPTLRVDGTSSSASGQASRMLAGENLKVPFTVGRATLTIEAPFSLQLQLRLDQRGKPPQFVPFQPAVLDPAQLVDGQTIELRVDPAAVQAALQKLAAK